MDITDTLNPALIYSTVTASCALTKNLTFSRTKWVISLIALLLYIFDIMVLLVRITDYTRLKSDNAATSLLNAPQVYTIIRILTRLSIICAGIVNQLHVLFFSHRSFVYVIQVVLDVDDVLKMSDAQLKKDRRIIWFYLISSLIFIPPLLYYSIIFFVDVSPKVSAYFTLNTYINQGVSSTELEYIALCQIIRSRFSLINTNLKRLRKQLKNGSQNTINKLKILRQTHLTLVKLAQRTNSIYNIRLFFSFMCCMVNVVTSLHFMVNSNLIIFEYGNINKRNFKMIVLGFLSMSYYTVRLTKLCLASELLCKEANATRRNVSNMVRYTCNKGLKHEVVLFIGSLSLTDININVARLAKMEVKLVLKVVVSATTILVTLAQISKNKFYVV